MFMFRICLLYINYIIYNCVNILKLFSLKKKKCLQHFCVSKQRVIHVTITEQYSIKHTACYIFDTFVRVIYDFSLSLQSLY